MSTILDALRKLQRERAAESPSRDLRGSLTTETPRGRAPRRGGSSRWAVLALLVVAVGGGYWLYSSGQLAALRARYLGGSGDGVELAEGDRPVSEEEFAALEREILAREAAGGTEPDAAAPEPTLEAAPPPQVAASPEAPAPRVDTPETLAERARLETALANARAAQEAQQKAAREAAAAAPPPTPPPVAEVPALTPPPEEKVEIAAQTPAPKPKAAAAKPKPPAPKPAAARPAPVRKPAPAPGARTESESHGPQSAFPSVRVESIRWHPIPERRVASLQFERQNVPQAREGDIVAGVLVYRIDPGAVELRIGTARRVVTPEP